MLNYCSNCGKSIRKGSAFCSECGDLIGNSSMLEYDYHYEVPAPHKNTAKNNIGHLPFYCSLAYIPPFFWLPLAFDGDSERSRTCANQGAWIMLLSIVSFVIAMTIGWFSFSYVGFDLTAFEEIYQYLPMNFWGFIGFVLLLPLSLVCILYLPINSMLGFFRGLSSPMPYILPLFGRIHLVKVRISETNI